VRDHVRSADAVTDVDPLMGYTVAVTAVRRAWEFGTALEHRGARIVYAPAARIVAPAEDPALHDATKRCLAAPLDVLVATTAAGLRGWFEAVDGWGLGDALRTALDGVEVVGRGPRVAHAARSLGLRTRWSPRADSVTDTIDHLIRRGVAGRRVAVALHGEPIPDLVQALRCAGADIVEATAFGWAPPADPRPLEDLVAAVAARQVDAVAFTSAPAARSFVHVAQDLVRVEELQCAARERVLVACVGPVTADPLRRAAVPVTVAPRAKLRALVRDIAERVPHHCGRVVTAAGHRLDVRGHVVVVDTVAIAPGAVAMALIAALGRQPGRLLSVAQLRAVVPDADAGAVTETLAGLGATLGDSRIVQSVGGEAFRLATDADLGGGCAREGGYYLA
jgi:uroporphyrinogen-III synthase